MGWGVGFRAPGKSARHQRRLRHHAKEQTHSNHTNSVQDRRQIAALGYRSCRRISHRGNRLRRCRSRRDARHCGRRLCRNWFCSDFLLLARHRLGMYCRHLHMPTTGARRLDRLVRCAPGASHPYSSSMGRPTGCTCTCSDPHGGRRLTREVRLGSRSSMDRRHLFERHRLVPLTCRHALPRIHRHSRTPLGPLYRMRRLRRIPHLRILGRLRLRRRHTTSYCHHRHRHCSHPHRPPLLVISFACWDAIIPNYPCNNPYLD